MNKHIKKLEQALDPYRQELINHDLYSKLNSVESIRCFMEQHVYAVWDFMSLLKSLQINLTSISIPWTPNGNPSTRRLINEIVWGEESDVNNDGVAASHYEMYIEAMQEAGANTAQIKKLLSLIDGGLDVFDAFEKVDMNPETRSFLSFTFDAILNKEAHVIAAIFTFGREDLIPDMFLEIVRQVDEESKQSLSLLTYYLERHIEVDGGEHGPMALNMISQLCGNDENKWKEATEASVKAMQMRINLWNGVQKSLNSFIKKNDKECV